MKLNIVPPRTGLTWVRQGVRTFVRQPLALGGLFFMFMAVVSVLSAVPLLGPVLALGLVPAATVGLMAASREADEGRFPMPLTLVTAFRQGPQRSRTMLVLGAAYAGVLLLIMLLAALLAGTPPTPPGEEITSEVMREALAGSHVWWLLLLYLPVMTGFWHAPALAHWHGVQPVKAVFFSFMACWANKGAMLLFLAGWMGLAAGVSMALVLVSSLTGSEAVLQMLLYPLVLLMASMLNTSIWFTFRDSFIDDQTEPTTTGESA